jgi:Holliday junction resolvasome RuvABC endonuclease subunit
VITIGIDPSINSTGICVNERDVNGKQKIKFYIIRPNNLTKKEQNIKLSNFKFLLYDKVSSTDKHENEVCKTRNLLYITDHIKTVLKSAVRKVGTENVKVYMEGISYGSLQTLSVFDLAGLNYLIRGTCESLNISYTIVPPSEAKKHATGKGNASKELISKTFLTLYPKMGVLKKVDDIADAYFMSI